MKLIIFDLDGVLVNTSKIHTDALHESIFNILDIDTRSISFLDATDGIRTIDKLIRLAEQYSISDMDMSRIYHLKNEKTISRVSTIPINQLMIDGIISLRSRGYTISVASNSRRIIVDKILHRLELSNLIDFSICGDEVIFPKPNSEIFDRVMHHFSVTDFNNVYIFEDSISGLAAAKNTQAKIIQVDPDELVTAIQLLQCK